MIRILLITNLLKKFEIVEEKETTVGTTKKVLLINAINWSDEHDVSNPISDVASWFSRHIEPIDGVKMVSIHSDSSFQDISEQKCDGVIISGSPRDAWDRDPVNHKLSCVVNQCKDQGIPLLGVCYGHQIVGRALKGEVARHPEGWELGNVDVYLTPAGRNCPLFADFPDRFDVLNSHADAVLTMPPDCELLAENSFSSIQAFAHKEFPIFGVQFHPEADPEVMRFIWGPRRKALRGKCNLDFDKQLDTMHPTPLTGKIFENFVNFYVKES